MLAGQITAPSRIELVDIPESHLAPDSRGEILFRPEIACLCGSDLPYFEQSSEVKQLKLGHSLHEMIGTVVETSGTRFAKGQRVLAVPIDHLGLFGRYPLSEERAIPIDTRVPIEQALMAQPLGTVIFSMKKLPTVLDQDVVVVGQGPMGQLINATLRNMGARQIIVMDLIESRLTISEKMGATTVIHNAKTDPVAAVRELTEGRGADIVIEAVGHKECAMNLCIDLCRTSGSILMFGVPPLTIPDLRWRELFWKNLTVYTSVMPDFRRDFPLAMRWIGEGRVDVSPIITHRFPVEQIQQAFELFQQRENNWKVLIDFPKS